MGWNTWNTFAADINEELIRSAADSIVKLGLREAGYTYVVIDDCWSLRERDPHIPPSSPAA
jgi:alpha-galactosidase